MVDLLDTAGTIANLVELPLAPLSHKLGFLFSDGDELRSSLLIPVANHFLHLLFSILGQEEFGAMRDHYLRSGEGFLVVYSITERTTFNVACELYESIIRLKEVDHVPIVLVGNKCDLEEKRSVSTMEAAALAKTWNIPFFETSAKNRYNIEAAFNAAVVEVRKELDAANGSLAKKDKSSGKNKCTIL